ncbi:hypothetical protein A2U01_0078673, partial [Trifolium medium]|nr:hypothetical protein [Trifolium medium]
MLQAQNYQNHQRLLPSTRSTYTPSPFERKQAELGLDESYSWEASTEHRTEIRIELPVKWQYDNGDRGDTLAKSRTTNGGKRCC